MEKKKTGINEDNDVIERVEKITQAAIVLVCLLLVIAVNLPPQEEVYYEDHVVEQKPEAAKGDCKITIHREKVIADYSFPRNSWVGMETADAEYLQLSEQVYSDRLTASKGVYNGVSGRETWYNLPMDNVIYTMRQLGYDEAHYPYWIREDGAKMLGDYVMCAANLQIRPKGTILQTSLGQAIVCDTGGFAEGNQTQIDIATNW